MRGAIARRLFLAASAVLALGLLPGRALAAGPQIVGWVEVVQLHADRPITLKAKMDSGAKTSSLAVTDLQRFSRRGQSWVRFRIQAGSGAGVARAGDCGMAIWPVDSCGLASGQNLSRTHARSQDLI